MSQKNNGRNSSRFADFIYNRAWLMLENAEQKGNAAKISEAKAALSEAFRIKKVVKNGGSVWQYYIEKSKNAKQQGVKPDLMRAVKPALFVLALALLVVLIVFAVKGLSSSCSGDEPNSGDGQDISQNVSNTDLGIYTNELDREWLSGIKLNDYSVYIRSGPGVEFEQIAQSYRYEDNLFVYLGEKQASDGALWYNIEMPDGTEGWVSAEFTKKMYAQPQNGGTGDSRFDAICEKYDVVGAQMAVVENGNITASYSYGWADIGKKTMSEKTVIRTASLSRIALTACALMLADSGELSLDEDISEYWGFSVRNPGWPAEKITVSDLLTDTSTLVYHDFAQYGLEDMKAALAKSTAFEKKFRPGTSAAWSFSNFNAGVAGVTLELAADESLLTYSHRELFRKLGMNASFISGELTNAEFASLYNSDHSLARSAAELAENKAKDGLGENSSSWASGLCCSAEDMARLLSMLRNGGKMGGIEFISEENINKAWKRMYTAKEYSWEFEQSMLMRYTEDALGCDGLYYYCGNAYGVLALACVDEESGKCVVVFTTGAFDDRDKNGIYSVCAELAVELFES